MTPQTIREEPLGKLTLRVLKVDGGYAGMVIGGQGGRPVTIHGGDKEELWQRLLVEAGKADKSYFGFDGARARFLKLFPDGFETARTLERGYKVKAKTKLDTDVPLREAATGSGFGKRALHVYQQTDLLSPYELAKLADALKSPAADAFIRAAAAFTLAPGDGPLRDMAAALKPFESAKWTVVTYLPFLWQPEDHAFLKPEVTKDFAARVGHRFANDYRTALDMGVYRSLLDLYACTDKAIADLGPMDHIDTQSFIWVVGNYEESDVAPKQPVTDTQGTHRG